MKKKKVVPATLNNKNTTAKLKSILIEGKYSIQITFLFSLHLKTAISLNTVHLFQPTK